MMDRGDILNAINKIAKLKTWNDVGIYIEDISPERFKKNVALIIKELSDRNARQGGMISMLEKKISKLRRDLRDPFFDESHVYLSGLFAIRLHTKYETLTFDQMNVDFRAYLVQEAYDIWTKEDGDFGVGLYAFFTDAKMKEIFISVSERYDHHNGHPKDQGPLSNQ